MDILSENTTYKKINNLTVSASQVRKEIHTENSGNIYNILLQQLYLCLGYIYAPIENNKFQKENRNVKDLLHIAGNIQYRTPIYCERFVPS